MAQGSINFLANWFNMPEIFTIPESSNDRDITIRSQAFDGSTIKEGDVFISDSKIKFRNLPNLKEIRSPVTYLNTEETSLENLPNLYKIAPYTSYVDTISPEFIVNCPLITTLYFPEEGENVNDMENTFIIPSDTRTSFLYNEEETPFKKYHGPPIEAGYGYFTFEEMELIGSCYYLYGIQNPERVKKLDLTRATGSLDLENLVNLETLLLPKNDDLVLDVKGGLDSLKSLTIYSIKQLGLYNGLEEITFEKVTELYDNKHYLAKCTNLKTINLNYDSEPITSYEITNIFAGIKTKPQYKITGSSIWLDENDAIMYINYKGETVLYNVDSMRLAENEALNSKRTFNKSISPALAANNKGVML